MGRDTDVGVFRSSDVELRGSLTSNQAGGRSDNTSPHRIPYISADENPAEISFRALLLSAFLAVILGAANVYLGLFAGLTVSASIPAAIISMSILRNFFSNVSILENNIVQTAASAGGIHVLTAIRTHVNSFIRIPCCWSDIYNPSYDHTFERGR